jgi:hypothetical protein
MNEWYYDLGFSALFSLVKATVKNPQSKENFKRAFLKLRNAINAAYANDPDFA